VYEANPAIQALICHYGKLYLVQCPVHSYMEQPCM